MSSIAILAESSGWHFQANDDTRGGWLAVGIYAVLVFLCWREVARQRSAGSARNRALQLPFWLILSLGVTALGINKQLDLQTLLRRFGRGIAVSEGLFEYRRLIEAGFVAVAAIAAVLLGSALWRLARRANRGEYWVLIGTAALSAFVLLRLASMNHVHLIGTLDRHRPVLALELVTLTFLCFAVWLNARPTGR